MGVLDQWRWIVAADILLHLIAVWWFAYLPPDTLNNYEKLIMVLASFAAIGVVTHACWWLRIPMAQWSYLLAGFVCLFSLMLYEIRSYELVPFSITIPFGLFLLAGTVSSFAAHIIDGGVRRRVRDG